MLGRSDSAIFGRGHCRTPPAAVARAGRAGSQRAGRRFAGSLRRCCFTGSGVAGFSRRVPRDCRARAASPAARADARAVAGWSLAGCRSLTSGRCRLFGALISRGRRVAGLGGTEPRHRPRAAMSPPPIAQPQNLPLRPAFACRRRFRRGGFAGLAIRSGGARGHCLRLVVGARCGRLRRPAAAPTPAAVRRAFDSGLGAERAGHRGRSIIGRADLAGARERSAAVGRRWPIARRALFGRGVGRCITRVQERLLLPALARRETNSSLHLRPRKAGTREVGPNRSSFVGACRDQLAARRTRRCRTT